jgi:hypothetical protein
MNGTIHQPLAGNTKSLDVTAKRESQIDRQLAETHHLTKALHNQLDQLREKVSPVFRCDPTDQGAKEDHPTLVPLAQELMNHNRDLHSLLSKVSYLIQGIEL